MSPDVPEVYGRRFFNTFEANDQAGGDLFEEMVPHFRSKSLTYDTEAYHKDNRC